ncbi:MAG: CocE/NonD family hydrolase [Steroidobacter sp.]
MTANSARPITRRELAVRFLQLAALVGLPARGFTAEEGESGVTVERDVMVKMRDGVHLATDIYHPGSSSQQRFPAILERTPYGKSQAGIRHASAAIARMLASHGYVVVHQDTRGRGKSEGAYVKYLSDAADGFDCCGWIVSQPWSNGKIGAQGLSYGAHTVAALASAGAPGIAALFLDSGGFANAYQGGIRQGGAFELKQVTWAYNLAFESPELVADPAKTAALKAVDLKVWFAKLPWSRGHSPLSLVPEYEDYVFDQWEAGTFDDYWKQPGIYAEGYYDKFSDAPMTWMSSWYDPYPRTATTNYIALSKLKRGPHRLILGPWTHGNNHQTFAGDVDFGAAATLAGNIATDLTTLRKRWFDRHLKGERNGVDDEPAVRIFVMGGGSGRRNSEGRLDHGGKWRSEPSWPLPGTRTTRYFMTMDGGLVEAQPKARDAKRVFRYDPRHPVPTIGGTVTSGQPLMVGGAFDQREAPQFYGSEQSGRALADRPDVLVFQTEPLASDVEITGAIEADLWIASDCLDTDFTIKLLDVYPPSQDYPQGYAMNLTDGILRCRYRDSWERPTTLEPGKPYKIRVSAFPTSNLFKAGHRIRLDISSSNFPHFDINPNTGEPEGRWRQMRVATNTVFVDARHPSSVVLPVIPSRA